MVFPIRISLFILLLKLRWPVVKIFNNFKVQKWLLLCIFCFDSFFFAIRVLYVLRMSDRNYIAVVIVDWLKVILIVRSQISLISLISLISKIPLISYISYISLINLIHLTIIFVGFTFQRNVNWSKFVIRGLFVVFAPFSTFVLITFIFFSLDLILIVFKISFIIFSSLRIKIQPLLLFGITIALVG